MPRLVELGSDRVHEQMFANGWTDGLPVVPPTPDRVEAMLATVDLAADDVLGSVPQRGRHVTAVHAATNAVLAGCAPEHFPIVVTALGAVLDPAFNAHAALSSTGGAATCVVVSGPLAAEIGMNAGNNALGSGNRANATIGRAVRLVARNVLGASSGALDATAMGSPAKYTFCFAEADPPAPWRPLRVELGHTLDDTTVTVMATEAPRQIANHLSEDPEQVLRSFAAAMKMPSAFSVGKGGQAIIVLGPEHALAVRQAGWSQERVRGFLERASRIHPDELAAGGIPLETDSQHDMTPGPDGLLPAVGAPDDVLLVTAGGAGPGWSAHIPSFAPLHHTRAVTRRVRLAGEPDPDCGPDGCDLDLSTFTRSAVTSA